MCAWRAAPLLVSISSASSRTLAASSFAQRRQSPAIRLFLTRKLKRSKSDGHIAFFDEALPSRTTMQAEPRRLKLARRSSTHSGGDNSDVSSADDELSAAAGAESAVASSCEATNDATGWNEMRRALRLAPIVPQCELQSGAMDVNTEQSQLGASTGASAVVCVSSLTPFFFTS